MRIVSKDTGEGGAVIAAPPLLRFTARCSQKAFAEWKATCGPHSIAAACGLDLERVRVNLPPYKGWMSPTMVGQTLKALEVGYELRKGMKTRSLCNGINRIQWEGDWLKPGVPARVAYFHTHWVAHFDGWVLCTACLPAKWIAVDEWTRFHLECEPVTPFHVTHHYRLGSVSG